MERGGVTLVLAFISGIVSYFLYPVSPSLLYGLLVLSLIFYGILFSLLFFPRFGMSGLSRQGLSVCFITISHIVLMFAGAVHLMQNPEYKNLDRLSFVGRNPDADERKIVCGLGPDSGKIAGFFAPQAANESGSERMPRIDAIREKIRRLNYSPPRISRMPGALRLRRTLGDALKKIVPGEKERTVLAALTLGDKSGLPYELKKSYRDSGAMHLLALSGLHTGILYSIIGIFLHLLDFHYRSRRIKLVLSLMLIALYAVATGLNASVLRAGLMIGIYRLAAAGYRSAGKWEVTAMAAGIILLFFPLEIFRIGFQLSFAAVCGIAGLFGAIDRCFPFRCKTVRKLWSLLALSVSCQIATGPIVWLYFKNIPPYFLLTNLAAVPLVTAVLYLFILSVLFYSIPIAGPFTAWLLQKSLAALNCIIEFIGNE